VESGRRLHEDKCGLQTLLRGEVPGYEYGFKRVRVLPFRLAEPLSVKKPTVYFVNSMSDLFHEEVPDSYIDRVMDVIARCPQHTFQILTKRAERLFEYSQSFSVPENAWLGVSVENKRHGVPRIEWLRRARSSIKFLSVEPLLEDVGVLNLEGLDWVIVGGESGFGARPMKPSWARSVQKQCFEQGVDFFFKQWGAHGADGVRRSKKANGRALDGRLWDQMPSASG
jgi:protein gp37